LAGFTPHQVFAGEYQQLIKRRAETMHGAKNRNPERFTHGSPVIEIPPKVVAINPAPEGEGTPEREFGVNFPTLKRANAI